MMGRVRRRVDWGGLVLFAVGLAGVAAGLWFVWLAVVAR